MTRLKGLSLFSSCGIGETYIKEYIDMKVANELLDKRCKLYNHFYPEVQMINGDIKDKFDEIISLSIKEQVNFIYATPPCQSFSKAGKQHKDDERDILFLYIIKAIIKLKPKYVLIENVPEFIKLSIYLNKKETTVLDVINENLSKMYNIQYDILNTENFNVPQRRKRAIILLSKIDQEIWNLPKKLDTIITVKDAIYHLPSLESEEKSDIHPWHFSKKHNSNHILWMSNTPTGKTAFDNKIHYPKKDGRRIKGYKTTYKRINWDSPAPTITMANGSISSQNNVHPGLLQENGLYNNARVLSIYELMLLTSLPSDWPIPKSTPENLIRQVIGECIPPNLVLYIIKNIPLKKK